MRVLVMTIVHHPLDARIWSREILAMRDAGHDVTYAAPFGSTGTPFPEGVNSIDLPRATGRRRTKAILAAWTVIRREAAKHDVVLVHDPELLLAAWTVRGTPVVWDVHEDTAAAVTLKPWLPKPLRLPVTALFRAVERAAESRFELLLAEDGYLPRFRDLHPVVPNSTPSPEIVFESGKDRVVYVGHLTAARGVSEMIELGRRLGPSGPVLHLVGSADRSSTAQLTGAQTAGHVVWHGFLPNADALRLVDGALAGLSLLHDEPNYRHSRPTKVMEYMAHGVPVITTPIPPAAELVRSSDCGLVVPFGDIEALVATVQSLAAEPLSRHRLAANGRMVALRDHDWRKDGPRFVEILEALRAK